MFSNHKLAFNRADQSAGNQGSSDTPVGSDAQGSFDFAVAAGTNVAGFFPATLAGETNSGAGPAPSVQTTGATDASTTETVSFGGVVFDNTFTASVSQAYKTCVLSAEQTIAGTWSNSVTIDVEFDAQAEGQNGDLASNSFSTVGVSYSALKVALASLESTESYNGYLQQAVANLPATDPSSGAGFELPLAYARMLGLTSSSQNPDDTVTLNTSYNWSYGQDVINTVEHEITEGGMGRIGGLGDQNSFWSTMDLFRYNSSGQLDETDGRDGRTTYFSYNGGNTLSSSAGLSFNNEYNSQGTQINQGDVADFTQRDVFGTGDPGETNTLSPTDIQLMDALGWNAVNLGGPAPPPGTTADMITNDAANGDYEIYDIGQNAILTAYPLTQISSPWQVEGLGDFNGTDTTDMMMRNGSTGAFQVYDISNNNITDFASIGGVGFEWQVAGFGDFSTRANETDMMMRNSNTGVFEVYDIGNNSITGASAIGGVGFEWQIAGFGDFSTRANESDMLLRNSNTGAFELYDIIDGQLGSAAAMGAAGLEWQVVGFGDFSGNANETDMMMRNSNTGAFELYDISNNSITGASAVGAVGFEWQVAGFGPINGAGASDMVLRNIDTGAFEVYDIANSALTTAALLGGDGFEWHVIGLAADPPTATAGASTSSLAEAGQTQQLVQAMNSFPVGGNTPLASPVQTHSDPTSAAPTLAASLLQHTA